MARRWVLGVALACALVAVPSASAARWTSGAPAGIPHGDVDDALAHADADLVADPAVPGRAFLRVGATLWVTDDLGDHWRRQASLPDDARSLQAFAGPPTVLTVLAGEGEIWRSADGGATFTHRGCCAIAIDPADSSIVLGRNGDVLRRSTDGGATFDPVVAPTDLGLRAFTFQFAAGGELYATTASGITYRSTDTASSWHAVAGVPEGVLTPIEGVAGRLWVGGFRSSDDAGSWHRAGPAGACDPQIAPTAAQPQTLWAVGCDAVFRSADGGDTWAELAGTSAFAWTATDAIAASAGGSAVLALGPQGPWLLQPDHAPAYRSRGLPADTQREVTADPRLPGTAYAQTFTTHDGGRSWAPRPSPDVVHVARVRGRLLTDGLRVSSSPVAGFGPTVELVDTPARVVADARGQRAFIVSDAVIWTTTDGIHLHVVLGDPRLVAFNGSEALEFAAAAGGRGRTLVLADDLLLDAVLTSPDAGRTFRFAFGLGQIHGAAVDAFDGRLVLVVNDRGLLLSRNSGRRFSRNLRDAVAVAVDPDRRGVWYAATTSALYRTRDAGHRWRRIGAAPGGPIGSLSVGAGRLWVSTDTRISSQPLSELRP